MNTQSNSYTVVYASIMVVVVAAILTTAAVMLKPTQQKNIDNEKRQAILNCAGINVERDQAENAYEQNVKETFVVNGLGQKIEGKAFDILSDMDNIASQIKALAKAQKEGKADEVSAIQSNLTLPVFKCGDSYVIPVQGDGLWGKIWGYISFNSDFNTINGVNFDHASETAGLGAEIIKDYFKEPFKGKTIFEAENLKGIIAYKGGKGKAAEAAAKDPMAAKHGVDAIAGATITSKAVETMVNNCLAGYKAYFLNNQKQEVAQPEVQENEITNQENSQE